MTPDNTILSPTIHEKVIERHLRGETAGALVAMRDAAQLARETCSKAAEVTTAVLRNEMKTPPARHKEAREAAFTLLERATQALDAAVKAAAAEMTAIKARTRGPAPPKDLVTEARHREVRARLMALPVEDRRGIIDSAIATDDDLIAGAVLGVHPWLTGLSQSQQDLVRHNWAAKRYPDDLDRLARLEKAVADAQRIGSLALKYVDGLTDAARVQAAEATEQTARAALAAVAAVRA